MKLFFMNVHSAGHHDILEAKMCLFTDKLYETNDIINQMKGF